VDLIGSKKRILYCDITSRKGRGPISREGGKLESSEFLQVARFLIHYVYRT